MFNSIIKNHLQSAITLHDSLHGFRKGWWTRTSTLEANLEQNLEGICQNPLFQVLLYVCKAYKFLYLTIRMELLTGCSLVEKISRIL